MGSISRSALAGFYALATAASAERLIFAAKRGCHARYADTSSDGITLTFKNAGQAIRSSSYMLRIRIEK